MTREIKFRAWDKKSKMMWTPIRSIDFAHGYVELSKLAEPESDKDFDEIELMQFTGQIDKNGKEIYEGDIVRLIETVKILYKPEFEQMDFIGKIEFDNEGADYNIIGNSEDDLRGLGVADQEIEIIGNIYEHSHLLNPELLEKK